MPHDGTRACPLVNRVGNALKLDGVLLPAKSAASREGVGTSPSRRRSSAPDRLAQRFDSALASPARSRA